MGGCSDFTGSRFKCRHQVCSPLIVTSGLLYKERIYPNSLMLLFIDDLALNSPVTVIIFIWNMEGNGEELGSLCTSGRQFSKYFLARLSTYF